MCDENQFPDRSVCLERAAAHRKESGCGMFLMARAHFNIRTVLKDRMEGAVVEMEVEKEA